VLITNQWRYSQSGPAVATWKEPAFDDSTWPQGLGLFYVETANLPAAKNTLLALGQNTYYFRTRFVLPKLPLGASLMLSNIIDDGVVFYLNGREIHRQGIDPGPVDFDSVGFDFRNPPNAVVDAIWAGPFTIPAEALVGGTNVLAAEVHQINAGSSDIVFGCTLGLVGSDLPGQTPARANNVRAVLPEFPPVWINEVLPNNVQGVTDSKGEREPWIELMNTGPEPISLDGWFLSDSYEALGKWPFPSGAVLPPHRMVTLFADGEPAESTPTEWHTNFRLPPSTGSVALSRSQLGIPAVVDYVDYSGVPEDSSVASLPDGQGLQRGLSSRPTHAASNAASANWPPEIGSLVDQVATVGTLFSFTVLAEDPDAGQRLSFDLEGQPPAGASIHPDTGLFSWVPTVSDVGTQRIRVRVTDDGIPFLSVSRSFSIQVRESTGLAIDASITSEGGLSLSWLGTAGIIYRVEYKESLREQTWNLLREVLGTGAVQAVDEEGPASRSERYYRVVVP
jgi:hypothetical protein